MQKQYNTDKGKVVPVLSLVPCQEDVSIA